MDRLHDHDSVVVTLPRGHYLVPVSFTARILAVEAMTVALEVERKAETSRLPDRIPDAFMTFRHGDALVGFRGTLHAARPVGDFRFVVADRAASRTRSTRINCMTRCTIRRLPPGGDPGPEAQGITVNIAPGGMLIEAAGADAVTGDLVEFRLTHPDDHDRLITGEANVVRHGDGLVAVAVSDSSPEARGARGALVVARSRALLHRKEPQAPDAPASSPSTSPDHQVQWSQRLLDNNRGNSLRRFLHFAGGHLRAGTRAQARRGGGVPAPGASG